MSLIERPPAIVQYAKDEFDVYRELDEKVDRAEDDGVEFRCVQGSKSPDDLVIEWWTDTGWRRLTFTTLALLVDFGYENEDTLYPPPMRGGEKLMDFLRFAATHGYQNARRQLSTERATAAKRPVPLGRRSR